MTVNEQMMVARAAMCLMMGRPLACAASELSVPERHLANLIDTPTGRQIVADIRADLNERLKRVNG